MKIRIYELNLIIVLYDGWGDNEAPHM